MWLRLPLFVRPRRVHSYPLPFRCQRADDNALTMALLTGCLIGLGLAWQVILSEEARGRIMGRVAGIATSIDAVEASEPRPSVLTARQVEGMPDLRSRPQQYHVASPPVAAARSAAKPGAVAPVFAKPLPERLVLAEENTPVEPRATGAEMRASRLEIVFDVNSSFLGPRAIAALRGLAGELPAGRQYRLALQAAVSDDGVKGAKSRESERYNRWLAERRLDRVAAWLREHGEVKFDLESGFINHDSSRRVTIAARPLP